MNQSSARIVASVVSERSHASGTMIRGRLASASTSDGHAVSRSNRSRASAEPITANVAAHLDEFTYLHEHIAASGASFLGFTSKVGSNSAREPRESPCRTMDNQVEGCPVGMGGGRYSPSSNLLRL